MASRGQSVRRSIYFLVAVPLITVIGLFAFVATTTVRNAINLDREPALTNATAVPAADFVADVEAERRAAAIYLADRTAGSSAQLAAAQQTTLKAEPTFRAAMTSPSTRHSANASEMRAIDALLSDVNGLTALRASIGSGSISQQAAIAAFSMIVSDEIQLFLQETGSVANAPEAAQSLALIQTIQARNYLEQEDSVLSAALTAGSLTSADRAQFTELAGQRRAAYADAISRFDPTYLAAFMSGYKKYAPADAIPSLTALEDTVAADPRHGALPVTTAQWEPVAKAVSAGYFTGGLTTAEAQVRLNTQITRSAWLRVAAAGGLGLLGLIVSVILSIRVGRRLIRRLAELRQSALTLAGVKLPDVVARLRRGEDVDVASEAPPMTFGSDEIGQVRQAFNAVQRTAVQSAVDEARLRRGINDVFRNLARRSQSLLHRQLTLLDAMERRASGPEALEGLFRLDHLTTRMRRTG
jgi:hypothetical protein